MLLQSLMFFKILPKNRLYLVLDLQESIREEYQKKDSDK